MMKKQISAVLAGVLALTLAGCGKSAGDDSLKKIQDAGVINIGLEGDWQPFSYHDENDDLVGYDVEVAKGCLLYTSPSPRDHRGSRMPSSA